jgi:hypothetical protein
VREQLRALVELTAIDTKAKLIDERLAGIPAELEARRMAVRKLSDLVARQEAALVEAETLLGSQEKDLQTRNDAVSKAKGKGAKAKNTREADAAERELETARRSIKDGEAEKAKLKERIERTRVALDQPPPGPRRAEGRAREGRSRVWAPARDAPRRARADRPGSRGLSEEDRPRQSEDLRAPAPQAEPRGLRGRRRELLGLPDGHRAPAVPADPQGRRDLPVHALHALPLPQGSARRLRGRRLRGSPIEGSPIEGSPIEGGRPIEGARP